MGGAAALLLGMGEGFGPVVNPVDRFGPLCEWRVIRVEGSQVVDVPQQVDPAVLLGAVVVVIGSVEIADQHTGELFAQHLVHHGLAMVPSQEVPLGGSAEGPDVAVVAILPSAGLVGMHHWAASDAFQLELLRKRGMDGDVDFLREALRVLVDGIMDAEVSAQIGAEHCERNSERRTYRNGYRNRTWDTRVGTMELHIPKVRVPRQLYLPVLLCYWCSQEIGANPVDN